MGNAGDDKCNVGSLNYVGDLVLMLRRLVHYFFRQLTGKRARLPQKWRNLKFLPTLLVVVSLVVRRANYLHSFHANYLHSFPPAIATI